MPVLKSVDFTVLNPLYKGLRTVRRFDTSYDVLNPGTTSPLTCADYTFLIL